jgi:5-methylcytosine-specific restriction protein A
MSDRPFRRPESLLAEQVTRGMVLVFLQDRGFQIDGDARVRNGQTITARAPDGSSVAMRVKLCWRRGSDRRDKDSLVSYSAAQLMARVTGNDWLGSIEGKMAREQSRGSTHLLFVQRDGHEITQGALVPISEVATIWEQQRDISDRLIKAGKLGKRKKNHAMNGASPTLWLQDDRGGQEVANALWGYPDVVNVGDLPAIGSHGLLPEEVSDPSMYQEGACRRISVNAYERDEHARWKCIEFYGTDCFICGFSFAAVYGVEAEGHIHVHHLRPLSEIAGPYTVDPIADLRPLCPNCHAVVHLNGGCRSIEQVQQMLAAARPGSMV